MGLGRFEMCVVLQLLVLGFLIKRKSQFFFLIQDYVSVFLLDGGFPGISALFYVGMWYLTKVRPGLV